MKSVGANYVLYWMIAGRRLRYNFALDRALEHCRALPKPLVIFEALRVGYPWASDRLHRFDMSPAAEGFLDELITWRELGYNFASHRKDYDQYESLPEWARKTLHEHAKDGRERLYSLEEFAAAKTHDSLWNGAETQLVREGRMHNYLRMLWGKKILEWSRTPQEAAKTMIQLNNKYAVDGRNPNSYSGIFWVLGRYDRPWGPERPIFGKIRYMSSQNTARKVSVKGHIRKYSGADSKQEHFGF